MRHSVSRAIRFSGMVLCSVPLACSTSAVSHVPAERALGPYSAAVAGGDLLFVSGQIGGRGATFEDEVHRAIDALHMELDRNGLGLGDVMYVTAYLTDIGLYEQFNAVYGERFPKPYPARACIGVSGLPAGARVEIQAVAHRRR